jgi:hypothetical protein
MPSPAFRSAKTLAVVLIVFGTFILVAATLTERVQRFDANSHAAWVKSTTTSRVSR